MRLLLFRGCFIGKTSRGGLISPRDSAAAAAAAAAAASRRKNIQNCGGSMDLLGSSRLEQLPVVNSQISRLWRPRACATEPGRDPHMHRGVHASPLHAPQPRARGKTRDRRRNVKASWKKKPIWCRVKYNTPHLCPIITHQTLPYHATPHSTVLYHYYEGPVNRTKY